VLVGDGPARAALEGRAAELGLGGLVQWRGYLSERRPYLDALAAADAFVHPSTAEGFPKVVLDAMAVGLPVIARPAGMLAQLGHGMNSPIVRLGDSLADALDVLGANADGQSGWTSLAERGNAFVRRHTRSAEAAAVVARLQTRWPALPWA
jgi:glycosyltransferase involved in cell wall biosynthesis